MSKKEKEYAKKAFDDVAHKYHDIAFFKISARQVVDIIKERKPSGDLEILDVACGTGNVVLECALCMPNAKFVATDISQGMLQKAEENAKSLGLENINFHLQDITTINSDKKYDVVTCSYALFFLPDAPSVLHTLSGLLKPDGFVVFTSFLEHAFAPSHKIILNLLQKYGSSSAKEYELDKWENLKHIKDIEHLCTLAKVQKPQIQTKEIRYGMSLDAWWELFNNTGYKGILMELGSENYEKVKEEYFASMVEYMDMDGEVELNADSFFVVVENKEKQC